MELVKTKLRKSLLSFKNLRNSLVTSGRHPDSSPTSIKLENKGGKTSSISRRRVEKRLPSCRPFLKCRTTSISSGFLYPSSMIPRDCSSGILASSNGFRRSAKFLTSNLCLGENLAKMEFFSFRSTSLIRTHPIFRSIRKEEAAS